MIFFDNVIRFPASYFHIKLIHCHNANGHLNKIVQNISFAPERMRFDLVEDGVSLISFSAELTAGLKKRGCPK